MARSKKDGRKGGAHRMGTRSKWHEAKLVRAARQARRAERATIVEQTDEMDQELYQDFLEALQEGHELSGADFDWHEDYLDWQDRYDYDPWQWEDNFIDYDRYEGLHPLDEFYEPEPQFDVFQAVDRAVRRHGVEYVLHHAALLAAALGCSSWEIQRAADLTRQGYIKAYG